MNFLSKILFWTFTIALGFVNPVITFVLVILYYLPEIFENKTTTDASKTSKMKSYSDDILKEMK